MHSCRTVRTASCRPATDAETSSGGIPSKIRLSRLCRELRRIGRRCESCCSAELTAGSRSDSSQEENRRNEATGTASSCRLYMDSAPVILRVCRPEAGSFSEAKYRPIIRAADRKTSRWESSFSTSVDGSETNHITSAPAGESSSLTSTRERSFRSLITDLMSGIKDGEAGAEGAASAITAICRPFPESVDRSQGRSTSAAAAEKQSLISHSSASLTLPPSDRTPRIRSTKA